MVYTKVVTEINLHGLQRAKTREGVYTNPASHGEGRFVASEECWIDKLFANGQVATQYCSPGRTYYDG